jgi:hypothetical protein
MTGIELHLTNGQTLRQTGETVGSSVEQVRDALSGTIAAGAAINLIEAGRTVVVNSAHVVYAVVTG